MLSNQKMNAYLKEIEDTYGNRKVTIYFCDEEVDLLYRFAKAKSFSINISGTARILIVRGLKNWVYSEKSKT